MAMQTEEDSIPQDITIQIFSWLPVKSLIRFRCISKFYNSIMLESNFVDLHLSNNSQIYRGDTKLIACLKDYYYALERHEYYQIENFNKLYDHINGHINHKRFESDKGLFCIWDKGYIMICNLTMGQVRFLPYMKCLDVPHDDEFICSIGFEPEENKYKVVLTFDIYQGLSRAWVFTLGVDKSWREIIKYDEHVYYIAPYKSGICISGIIYRFSYAPKFCIVAFDVKSEIFSSITMSIELRNSLYVEGDGYMFIEVNGKLGILNIIHFWYTEDLHLWIYGEKEWEQEIFRFPLGWDHDFIDLSTYRICKYGSEEIVFALNIKLSNFLVCLFYDINNKSWRYFVLQKFPDCVESIFTYSESLFPLDNIGSSTIII